MSRQAWLLQSGEQYLRSIEMGIAQWTPNPAEAMSWLNADLTLARLRKTPALQKTLGTCNLTLHTFKAQLGIHPLDWQHDPQDPGV